MSKSFKIILAQIGTVSPSWEFDTNFEVRPESGYHDCRRITESRVLNPERLPYRPRWCSVYCYVQLNSGAHVHLYSL